MKHAGADALAQIEGLLATLRGEAQLKERGRGIFYRRGKAFLHFHEDPAGIFADLKRGDDWVRFPVSAKTGQRELLKSLAAALAEA